MTNKEIILFKRWLAERGLLMRATFNVYNAKFPEDTKVSMTCILQRTPFIDNAVASLFWWQISKEGLDFWINIAHKWNDYCYKHNLLED